MHKDIKILLEKLNIKYKNIDYYIKAQMHSSYANENNLVSNERLEFLGDAILELTTSLYLYNLSNEPEGELTKRRAQLVCEDALYMYAQKIGLDKYLYLGRGESLKGHTKAEVADFYEAFLAAIFLDLGMESVKEFFNKNIVCYFNLTKKIVDYKSRLQELVQSDKRTISYQIVVEKGPSHNKFFEAIVLLDNKITLGKGSGKSKKEAEQNAAKQALEKGVVK